MRREGERDNTAARRLARLESGLARRNERVRVAGFDWALETLDDLDAVIDQLVARLPAGKDGQTAVPEVCPHFGVLWPAALALAEHLAARGALAGLAVVELGCGLGLPSMLARRLGARRVVATDRHPLVPLFLARNAAANGIEGLEYRALDWRLPAADLGEFDLVIGSDLLYEPWQPGFLASLLGRLVAPGGEAVIADPGRRYVDAFVTLLEAGGFRCDLGAVRPIRNGGRTVEVLVVEARRPAASA